METKQIMKTLKDFWIKSSDPNYHLYYWRLQSTWTIEKRPNKFINLSKEEKKEYFRNKAKEYKKRNEINKLRLKRDNILFYKD